METAVSDGEQEAKQRSQKPKDVAVAVITTAGIFPNEHHLLRVDEGEDVKTVLHKAADKLDIKDYADWEAFVDGQQIEIGKSFKHNHLKCIVEIDWHKPEGGGGARSAR